MKENEKDEATEFFKEGMKQAQENVRNTPITMFILSSGIFLIGKKLAGGVLLPRIFSIFDAEEYAEDPARKGQRIKRMVQKMGMNPLPGEPPMCHVPGDCVSYIVEDARIIDLYKKATTPQPVPQPVNGNQGVQDNRETPGRIVLAH